MKTLKTIPFDVQIPNFDGDGIAETIRIEVQAYTDEETGEDVLTPEAVELIETTQARHMGLLSPLELRELRERLDLTQEQMSDLLQIGAKTYTRWESGRARPSRSLNVLLCALRDGVVTVDYLRCLRDGRDWTSLLTRRLENSIVFQFEQPITTRVSPMHEALKYWIVSSGDAPELGFVGKKLLPRRHRQELDSDIVPNACLENALAA